MSDIWSRAWCETQQIPNFALKGVTPSNEVRDAPNYIPRVNSNPTQYGSIYDNSRSPSPELRETLCFQFRKKENKKPRTPLVLRKPRNVPESHPPSPNPSTQTPPASPGQVRVLRRPSHTSISIPRTAKLPDVVISSPTARNNKNDTKTVAETIQHSQVPVRNCAHTDIPRDNIKNRNSERGNRTNLQELEAENQRLKDICKVNSITIPNKNNFSRLQETLNCMKSCSGPFIEEQIDASEKDIKSLNADKSVVKTVTSKNVETVAKKKTVYRSEGEKDKDNPHGPKPHRSMKTDIQGSAPPTPALNSRRMSKNNTSGSTSNINISSNSGSTKHIPHKLNAAHVNKSLKKLKDTPGYVFLGSGGQVLAECKGHSSQVIVKNVRSSVCDSQMLATVDQAGSEHSDSDEEFEVEKILASQKLREISLRMEKCKNENSYT